MRRPLSLVLICLASIAAFGSCAQSSSSGDAEGAAPEGEPALAYAEIAALRAEEPRAAEPSVKLAQNETVVARAGEAPRADDAARADTPPPLGENAVDCPADMVLVEGEYCTDVRQDCLEWMDYPSGNLPHHRCAKFAPSVCIGQRVHKRFCMDRDEFTREGETLPEGDVNWTDAGKECGKHGKRLCMESEWQFACEGEEMLPYPYGHERDAAKCNHDKDDLLDRKGNLKDYRRPASELSECTSPFGIRNMTGNIDEWVNRDGFTHPWRSGLKGGWWLAGRNRCRPATTAHDEYFHGPQTGFRCCR